MSLDRKIDELREHVRFNCSAAMIAQFDEVVAALEAEAGRVRAEATQPLRDAAFWVLNVASNIGKSGGPPEEHEYTDALNALETAYQNAAQAETEAETSAEDVVGLISSIVSATGHTPEDIRSITIDVEDQATTIVGVEDETD